MIEVNLTAAVLIGVLGAALSVLFTWFPGLNTWYAGMTKDAKSGIMLGLLAATAAAIIQMGCFGLISVNGLVCTQQGILNTALNLVVGLVGAMAANQGTYSITKNLAPAAVKNNGTKIA